MRIRRWQMGNASSKDTRFQLFIFEVISKCSGKKLNLKITFRQLSPI